MVGDKVRLISGGGFFWPRGTTYKACYGIEQSDGFYHLFRIKNDKQFSLGGNDYKTTWCFYENEITPWIDK